MNELNIELVQNVKIDILEEKSKVCSLTTKL